MWFYPDGVPNILLQHRMVLNSGWSLSYSSDRFYKTRDLMDLLYDCEMKEGKKFDFMQTEELLYVLNCAEYFGLNKTGYVFSKRVNNNGTGTGSAMIHKYFGINIDQDATQQTRVV